MTFLVGGEANKPEQESARRTALVAFAACVIAIAIQGGFASLSDPDLPSHLALGEWIATHRSVPYHEPFAWTRAGAPFYAYSWLTQLAFYAVLRSGGPLGLHLLAALLGASIALASGWCARALGARWEAATVYAVAASIVAYDTTPFLRPQLVMFALVPLAWVCVAGLRRDRYQGVIPLIALFLLNAVAAAVHISFPVMASALVLLVGDEESWRSPRAWFIPVVTIAGWFASPYGLVWADVFRVNFAANAITKYPAPTGELTPGFIVSPLIGGVLAALPLFAFAGIRTRAERLAYGAIWLVGLLVFARMYKGLGPWWWSATPLAVLAVERIPRVSSEMSRRVFAALLVAFTASLAIANVRLYPLLGRWEGDTRARTLPSMKAFAAEPAIRWLEQNTRRGASGRALTSFNYGSYLEWRLPWLSPSIDGRTIFPDSAARPDVIAEQGERYDGPWRSADLALVPMTYSVAQRLDSDSAWSRVGVAAPAPWATAAPRATLWVRRSWWERAKRAGAVLPDASAPALVAAPRNGDGARGR